ncbi:MAG: PVC-type heme-binding CxxCH protein [Actinomycetota bacterium]
MAGDLPNVPEGFTVEVFAREPLVRNPCALAFDREGRLYVSQGQQYREPEPDTPGDRVTLLLDTNGDGVADEAKTFAEGFNHIQGLAWRGDELWVAAAPELVVVRDTDGDDVADEYTILYGGLGNLEHALHGLNPAPDGRMYMSKGNSKGYVDESSPEKYIAPRAFRELWGLNAPPGTPDVPEPRVFDSAEAFAEARGYHHPSDDWGTEGGILRCDPDGRNLEIFSRGLRNPWDITFDEHFNWLGTDQDQDGGDRVVRPFYGAHFGWGHAWSPHWTGEDHLPTVPISGPTFHGSGTGVVYCTSPQFPPEYRGVFFMNDWLKRQTVVYRPEWAGAMMRNMAEPEVFAAAPEGRAMGSSSGVLYDVVDMKMGPNGALWVTSWGHGYGATVEDGEQIDKGRVYRISYGDHPPYHAEQHRSDPLERWSVSQLIADLRHDALPVWRIDTADELVRRGEAMKQPLIEALHREDPPAGATTWIAWTLGRLDAEDQEIDALFSERAARGALPERVQALRILGDRARRSGALPDVVVESLTDDEPRVRFAAVQAIHESHEAAVLDEVWELVDTEQDRAVFYAAWRALGDLADEVSLRQRLSDERGGVRRATLLALLEQSSLTGDAVAEFRLDTDEAVAQLASSYLEKVGTSDEPVLSIEPGEADFSASVQVRIISHVDGLQVRYTTDGTNPTDTTGERYSEPLVIAEDTTVRVALFRDRVRVGPIIEQSFRRTKGASANDATAGDPGHVRIASIRTESGSHYRAARAGLRVGKRVYTNRPYTWTDVPDELTAATTIQTANDDADVGSRGERFLTFELAEEADVYIAHDRRINAKPDWLSGFEKTEHVARSDDTAYDLYRKRFDAGKVVLGGNTTDGQVSGRSQYAVAVVPAPITLTPRETQTTVDEVVEAVPEGRIGRGRRLFFGAAGCASCHRVGTHGESFAPDLSDLDTRGDARAIAEAILDPGATITEGYQGLTVTTEGGESYFGFIRQESGLTLDIVQANGEPVSIRKAEIASRQRVDGSVMPAFQHTLGPQDVADLIAYLTASSEAESGDDDAAGEDTESSAGPSAAPDEMSDAVYPAADTTWGNADAGFQLLIQKEALEIRLDGRPIASYVFQDEKTLRPYFVHVTTPRGIQVTRNHPPIPGEDPTDHATMHPGLWLAFADLNGISFWHNEEGRVVHDAFVGEPTADEDAATFATRNRYVANDGTTICSQRTHYTITKDPAGYRIEIDATFQSNKPFYFGVKEEMGLGMRVASGIRVADGTGTIRSASGGRDEEGTWGKVDRWWDYAGEIDGRSVGVMILSAPENPNVWSHSRDYGVLVANPFPVDIEENRGTRTTVSPGEAFRLRFGILIHDAEPGSPLDRKEAYHRYLRSLDKDSVE